MKFFDRFKNEDSGSNENSGSNGVTIKDINELIDRSSSRYVSQTDSVELTYFVCLKTLSESVGKLGIHLKDGDGNKVLNHPIINLLAIRPNSYQSPSDFKMELEYHRNHNGNAYAYLDYNKVTGYIDGIYILDPTKVDIIVISDDDKELLVSSAGEVKETSFFYRYTDSSGKESIIPRGRMLHLKGGIGSNGLSGKSIAEVLSGTISSRVETQKYLNNLYKNGLTANAVIKYTGDLDKEKKKRLIQELSEFGSSDKSERIIPLPLGMDLIPLDLKLTDSQFYELNKFNSLQIASAFGIKPNQLNDYSKSSYANSEMQNLTFYVDTLLIILTKYEEEFNFKLLTEEERARGLHFEFNINTILRGDIKTQAESLGKLTQSSIYTINESRKYLGMPKIDDGDVIMVNGSYVRLEEIGKAYSKYDSEEK